MSRRVIAIPAAFAGGCQVGQARPDTDAEEVPVTDTFNGRPALTPEDADRCIVARHIGEEFAAALAPADLRRAARAIVNAIRWQGERE